jgi:alpha-N-arabinofuranosidase
MTHPDLEAANTLGEPDKVTPKPGSGVVVEGGSLHARLPPLSYQMIRLALG